MFFVNSSLWCPFHKSVAEPHNPWNIMHVLYENEQPEENFFFVDYILKLKFVVPLRVEHGTINESQGIC